MELPSDPGNLIFGIYDKMGRDLTKERTESNPSYWALRDDDDDFQENTRETPFDCIDYNYNFW